MLWRFKRAGLLTEVNNYFPCLPVHAWIEVMSRDDKWLHLKMTSHLQKSSILEKGKVLKRASQDSSQKTDPFYELKGKKSLLLVGF